MISSGKWFDRTFSFDLGIERLPLIIERLRGTPARIEERVQGLSAELLTKRVGDAWSIQENVGHLLTAEPLWIGRLDDLLHGEKELRPADLKNKATFEADYNSQPIADITKSFRALRYEFVTRLEALDEKEALLASQHPRLRQPMRTLDLVYFIAEHDDHHLTVISGLMSSR